MASGSAGSIYVDLLLRDSGFQQGLRRANTYSQRTFGGISNDASKARGALASVLNPVSNITAALGTLGVGFAAAMSVQRIVQYSDAWKQLQGRLSIVESDMQAVGVAQEALFEIAQRNRSPLENVTNFYQRLNQFVPEAVRNQYDLLGVTESVTAAIAITGENSLSANAALVQFSQAIGTNFEAAGQELRSIQEQAPRLAKALSTALGGGTKSLQTLKEEGILTRDSVLRALSGMGEEGRRMAAELAKIPLTVGQAFTRLDNAFLKFIGQNELVTQGTSSLAASISFLAENLDGLANGVSVLTLVVGGRLVGSLTASAASFAFATSQATAYQIALARMAGISASAAVGQLTLARAASIAGGAMALVGGPVGLLVIALGAVSYQMLNAGYSAEQHGKALTDLVRIHKELDGATSEQAKKLKEEAAAHIENARAALKETEALLLLKDSKSTPLGTGVLGLAGELKADDYQLDDLIKRREQQLKQIQELEIAIQTGISPNAPNRGTGGNGEGVAVNQKEAKKLAKELQSLYEKNERYIQGLSKEQYDYNRQIEEFDRLWRQGKISYEEYYNAVSFYHDELAGKTKSTFLDMEAISKRAAENMQDAFADFLFNPFEDGLKGMLRSFVETMQKMLAQQVSSSLFATIAQSAVGGAMGAFTKGGFNNAGQAGLPWQGFGSVNPQGGVYSGNFGGFFADGGFLQPGQWGIAGEEGAEMIYGGRTGATVIPNGGNGKSGNTYNIDARGADEGAVRRLEAALMSLAGPGQIEKRVSNAQRRGAL